MPQQRALPPSSSVPDARSALHSIRNRFTPDASAEKDHILRRLLRTPPRLLRRLVQLHDDLLFLRAFPDSADMSTLAREGLDLVARRLQRLPRTRRTRLDDSGIASSNARHTFPFAIARWLVDSYPSEVDVDWPELIDYARLDPLIRTFLTRAEEDGFDGLEQERAAWLRVARPKSSPSTLQWLIERAEAGAHSRRTFAAIYDAAPLPIRWRLTHSRGSTTHNELSTRRHYRTAMRRAPEHPLRHIAAPLPGIELLQPRQAGRVIDVARAALTSRCREVFPISNPNRNEVWLADLGEGASLAIIGAMPAQRMSLETNYGYLLMSNGIPIGYGGVTPLFCQANTGINIFDPFRGSEAAFLWAQMLRAFHSLFGVRRFVVNAYQIGAGNAEAIASGAFWFYYRLGFRPSDPATRAVAAEEALRLARNRNNRSPERVLKRLALSDLHLTLPGFVASTFFAERLLSVCSTRVTQRLSASSASLQRRRMGTLHQRVMKSLGVRSLSRWPSDERKSFELLAPVMDLLPDVDRWTELERRGLIQLMRAKGANQEREFVLLSQTHPRFWLELRRALRTKHGMLPPDPYSSYFPSDGRPAGSGSASVSRQQ